MLVNHTGAREVTPEEFGLEDFERAGVRVVERRFRVKDEIFTPGDPDDRLYFLLSGTVRIYRTYGYFKEATTALLKDEGMFGGSGLTENGPQEDCAEALTEAHVAYVRKASVVWLVKRRPEVALALFSVLAERNRRSDELVANLLPREVSSRLAILLLNLGERLGQEDETGTMEIGLRLPHAGWRA